MAGGKKLNRKGNAGASEETSNRTFRRNDVSEQEATKRLAQQGQWRTPPLPVFAACTYATSPAAAASNLPTTTDEYARMLQEAYKRGAEAGARAQKPATLVKGSMVVGVPPQPQPTSPYSTHQTGNTEGIAAVGTLKMPSIQVNSTSYTPSVVPTVISSNASRETLTKPPPPVSHSKSMPDMSSYQATLTHVDDEEDKRKKRLARNRASARLRRLKKKNLVDSYEGEVGVLESALSKLRSHKWGSSVIDHEALIEALSMERGQQPLTSPKRRELVQSIISQQREQVTNLLECQVENWVLSALVDSHDRFTARETGRSSSEACAAESHYEDEFTQVTSELHSMLQLSPDQISLIKQSSRGCVHEVKDLLIVDSCLRSIHANRWLLDEGVDEFAEHFTSLLNSTQLSKFLLWSDHNADSIDKLDYVNVLSGVAKGPVFEFGVDEGLADGD
ncbi:hypothetical protein ACHAXR_003381 [Thalassiosira sp. AJA248-18]